MEKAGSRRADVLVLDLEDGVHPDQKETGARAGSGSLKRFDFGDSEVWCGSTRRQPLVRQGRRHA
jgi:citrate lyase beta subunit